MPTPSSAPDLTRRILLPLSGAALLFLFAFLVIVQSILSGWTESEQRDRTRSAGSYIEAELRHHYAAFGVLAAALAGNPAVREGFRQRDGAPLTREASPFFQRIHGPESVSEMLFLTPDRIPLLQLGSEMKRHEAPVGLSVLAQAETTGATAVGLGICNDHRFRLWGAHPVVDGGELLGYIVIGSNFDHILHSADRLFRLRHVIVIEKSYLAGQGLTAVQPVDEAAPVFEWNRFQRYYALDTSLPALPPRLEELLGRETDMARIAGGVTVELDGQAYFTGAVPLTGIGDEAIGQVITLKNVSPEERLVREVAFSVGGVGVLLSAFLYALFYRTTRQVGGELDTAYSRLEESHRRVENAYRDWKASVDGIGEPIFTHDAEYRIIRANKAYAERAGMHFDEMLGRRYWEVFPRGEGPLPGCAEAMQAKDRHRTVEEEFRVDGRTFVSRGFPVFDGTSYSYSVHILEDVTDRQRMTESLRREVRARRIVSASNHALIHATSEQELLQVICDIVTGLGDYHLAWVGSKDEGLERRIEVMAASGVSVEALREVNPSWTGDTPVARCLSTGERQFEPDLLHASVRPDARIIAERLGCGSVLALPLQREGRTFGVLAICSAAPEDFNEEEVTLLSELAGDLAFGLTALRSDGLRRRAEQERLKVVEKLEASLEKTVQAMAIALEARDPYTAGHQRRVAELAAAIARELDLPPEEVEAVRIAGIVHDIGKIYVPAEILSKPGRLTHLEFELVKTHAEVGYGILKEIDFPWPVADMVHQHHERIDGSGYPLGLQGDAILPGARILAVADVIEAMATHRPYRPGLSIDTALAEIVSKRGTQFEAAVVDACVRLFREKGYQLT